jgi:hypothetical protein
VALNITANVTAALAIAKLKNAPATVAAAKCLTMLLVIVVSFRLLLQ